MCPIENESLPKSENKMKGKKLRRCDMKGKTVSSKTDIPRSIRLVCVFPERQEQEDNTIREDVKKILSMELKQQMAQQ